MKLLTVDTIEEARQKLLEHVSHRKMSVKTIESQKAFGQILAKDIFSPQDIPSFRRSTVDGYAVICTDTTGAKETLPVLLKFKGAIEMGKDTDITITCGECAYVPTGGIVPQGADAVIMIEHSEMCDGDASNGKNIAIYKNISFGSNIINIGEDAKKDSLLLKKGTKILSQHIGAMYAAGLTETDVFCPLQVTIISCGDELIPVDAEQNNCQIFDINSYTLKTLAKENLLNVVNTVLIKDDESLLEKAVIEAKLSSDIVIISAGSSKGEKDFTQKVISKVTCGEVFTQGLAVKPGKPTILGFDKETDTLFIGLPGHPVSAIIVFKILVSWLIKQLTCQKEPLPIPAKISCNIAGTDGRTTFQPVSLEIGDEGYIAHPVYGKSGAITTLTKSCGYIVIDRNKEGLKKDETVLVFPWE